MSDTPTTRAEKWADAIKTVQGCDADKSSVDACLARMRVLSGRPLDPISVMPVECGGLLVACTDDRGHRFEHEFIDGIEEVIDYDRRGQVMEHLLASDL